MSKKQPTTPPKCTLRPRPKEPFSSEELKLFSLGFSKQAMQAQGGQMQNNGLSIYEQEQFLKSEYVKDEVKISGEYI